MYYVSSKSNIQKSHCIKYLHKVSSKKRDFEKYLNRSADLAGFARASPPLPSPLLSSPPLSSPPLSSPPLFLFFLNCFGIYGHLLACYREAGRLLPGGMAEAGRPAAPIGGKISPPFEMAEAFRRPRYHHISGGMPCGATMRQGEQN